MKRNSFILLTTVSLVFSACQKDLVKNDSIGFNESTFEEHEFIESSFQKLDSLIISQKFGEIHSIIIVHEDELIKEKYYHSNRRNDIHEIQSVTKSTASLLIGEALEEGSLDLDDQMVSLFPGYSITQTDPGKTDITLAHMLSMSTGLEWDEWSIPYGQEGNSLTNMYLQANDYVTYVLNLPMESPPGSTFTYNSGVSYLLGAALQLNTGDRIEEFAKEYLFGPLEIPDFHWSVEGGYAHTGGGLYLRPVDMAKIGSLVLNKGKWKDEQVISPEWIDASITKQHEVNWIWDYGYQWWLFKPPLGMQNIIQARGYGWQSISVVPDLDMVVVTTGLNKNNETVYYELDLILYILSVSPKFHDLVMEEYERQLQQPSFESENIQTIKTTGFFLIQYEEYQKASDYLLLFEDVEALKRDFFFTFILGEALFNSQNYEEAKKYLLIHLSVNQNNSLSSRDYYQRAEEMLSIIDSHTSN